ncbi:hypothetical protein D1P53_002869 [Cryptococcus gattii VGV]|nr:hypothetical protein D1P53_002869 [Cryptococcus gattii VGV]
MPREGENDRSRDYRDNDRESERTEHDERYRPRSERNDRERRRDRSRSRSRDRDGDREKNRDSRRRHRDPGSRSPSHHRHAKDRSEERHHKSRSSRRRSRSVSSNDSSDYSSDSESEDERRRRKRKERERKREKEEKEERRRRKEKKRARRDKKKRETAASTHSWGQYGIISEIDLPKKDSPANDLQEFRAWLVEERKINPETISKDRTKKEFAVYVEDYNTATLGHEKYYDMDKYMVKLNMIRSGQTLPDESGGYDPMADMKAHSSSLKSKTAEPQESYLSPQEVAELRRIEAERREISKRKLLGMNVPKNMGVRTEDADY